MSDTPSFDPSTTALLLVEYQNDFASEGGSLHGAVAGVMERTAMLDHSAGAAAAARQAGATVIHAPLAFDQGHEEIADSCYGILKGVVDSNAFTNETWGGGDHRADAAPARGRRP